jgi:branched-chain amino acid transport system permease protein
MHVPVVPHFPPLATAFKNLSPTRLSLVSSLVVVALLALAPQWLPRYWSYLLAEVLIFALFAISFNVLFGFTGMLSFGQASIFAAGAYSISLLLIHVTSSWWLAFLGSVLISTGLAALIGIFSIQRSEIYFGMLTLAFAMLFYSIIYKWNSVTGGADGLSGIPSPVLDLGFAEFEILSPMANYYFILVVVAICYFRAARHHELALRPSAPGHPGKPHPHRVPGPAGEEVQVHRLCHRRVFTGVAGALFGPFAGTIDALSSHWSKSGEPIFMSLIGGISTLVGPGVGTMFYYVLHSYIVSFTEYWQLVMGCILILTVMVFPMGITGYGKKFILSAKSR